MSEDNLQKLFGSIDIYLFDQLLKGRFVPGMRLLDAGCGSGRNLVYFLRSGFEVFGVDESEEAVAQTRRLAATLAPQLPADNFRVESVEKMSWESAGIRLSADPPDYRERRSNQQAAITKEPQASQSGADDRVALMWC